MDVARVRAGNRPRGRGRDAGRPAPDDRRAGHRPARLRPAGLRRRRAPARRRPGATSWASSASSAPAPPACSARSASPPPLHAATSRAPSCCAATRSRPSAWQPSATPCSPRPAADRTAQPARTRVRHELRYRGQSFELSVEQSRSADPEVLREAFARAHELRYGYRDGRGRGRAGQHPRVGVGPPARSAGARLERSPRPQRGTHPIVFDGEPLEATVHRGELPGGTRLQGPALCALPEATLLVPPGWAGEVDPHGTVHLREPGQASAAHA